MKNFLFLPILLTVALVFIRCTPKSVPKETQDLLEKADFIFQGTVLKLNASTMPDLVKEGIPSIVRVEKVIKSNETLASFEGMEITVMLDDPKVLQTKEGETLIFFTDGWLFGNSLAVVAKDKRLISFGAEKLQKEAVDYKIEKRDSLLLERIYSSQAIVLGKVRDVKALSSNKQDFISEHNPMWAIATLQVQEVIKGEGKIKEVKFYFAQSDDVQWYKSPKFDSNSKGIFLLRRPDATMKLSFNDGFVVTNPLDFQDESMLKTVKRLFKK